MKWVKVGFKKHFLHFFSMRLRSGLSPGTATWLRSQVFESEWWSNSSIDEWRSLWQRDTTLNKIFLLIVCLTSHSWWSKCLHIAKMNRHLFRVCAKKKLIKLLPFLISFFVTLTVFFFRLVLFHAFLFYCTFSSACRRNLSNVLERLRFCWGA